MYINFIATLFYYDWLTNFYLPERIKIISTHYMKKNFKGLLFFLPSFIALSSSAKFYDTHLNENKKYSYNLPGTVIIPASDFLDKIPKGNIITDAGTQHTAWLFNNTDIVNE